MTILGALMGFLLLSGANTSAPSVVTAPTLPSYPVTLTAYNAVPEQTDDTPFETASGAYSNPEVVAARSQDLGAELPFGTIIQIDGPAEPAESCGYDIVAPLIGYRVIADTMNARFTNRIDVLFDTEHSYVMGDGHTEGAGSVMGICPGVTVRVVGHVKIGKMPKTQKELAALVGKGGTAIAVK